MQYKVEQNDTDVLMSALAALTDKNQHLETSLSSETRLKLDLFSALGDAKRQLEIQQGQISFDVILVIWIHVFLVVLLHRMFFPFLYVWWNNHTIILYMY